ncbi:MAG TPA: NAD-dependent epimerase/dehydratase family protein [Tepidisphaeraceae bacterium]|nr:NAD-dependent epimerase/dehydratase family protein [Tepidisphaeraceae bacterium]
MRILVTGGAGFIGSNLAKRLAADGHDVTAADALLAAPYSNLIDFPGDVLTLKDPEDLDSMTKLGKLDVIFHQASMTGVVGGDGTDLSGQSLQHRMMRNNVETFRGILEWAAQTKARVIWASSCSIYGRGPVPMRESQPPDPLNIYAFSKLAMERLAARYAPRLVPPTVGLRYTNVYGPGEGHKGKLASMIHQLAAQMRAGKRPRIFTAGQQRRDFVYVDDVVQANLKALTSTRSGVFNIGSGKSWSFNELVAELNRALKINLQPDYFDNPYSFTQDWTEADLTESRRCFAYEPQFNLSRGIDAYLASGKLGL